MTNHLWQSTWFAILAGLATLAFRKNRAQVRYWLWFSASVKFLIPLALLMSLGSRFEWTPAAHRITAPEVSLAIEQVTEPFPETVSFAPQTQKARDWTPLAIFAAWACGFLAIAMIRFRGWLRIRAAVRASVPLEIPSSVAVRASPGLLEPGVVGFLRPILLVPEGIAERLTSRQLEAVLAHELCHVRRRDNLTSAIHMLVEAIFWFHPFVWWIGARLVEERERACDEGVLSLGNEPQVYAEAILNVCKLYVESPLACVAGVTGADLKRRIETIMNNPLVLRLNFAKKAALAVAAITALAAPIMFGMINHLGTDVARASTVLSTEAGIQADPPQIVAKQTAPSEYVDPKPVDPKTYLIGPADVLSIATFNQPDLTRVETVRADGTINMPLIGEVQAAGLTADDFGARLKAALSTYIVNPDVTVTILQLNSRRKAAAVMANVEPPLAPQPTPVFEVASIKPCGSDAGGMAKGGGRSGGGPGGQGPSPDRLNLVCQPAMSLIRMAYINFADGKRRAPGPMPPIDGGPSWIDSERYKVDAKAEGAPGQEMMRGPMLQALLEDRFKLKVHRESREVPVYSLVVAKVPKLTPFQEGSCTILDFSKPPAPGEKFTPCAIAMRKRNGTVDWNLHGATLDEFARDLGSDLDRIIINKTGISGKYDFHLDFAPDETTAGLNSLRVGPNGEPGFPQPAASDPSGGPSIFTAIQELGLKLESAKGPREFLVIERVEKPSEN